MADNEEKPLVLNVHFHKALRFIELTMTLIGTGVCYGSALWVVDKIRSSPYEGEHDGPLVIGIFLSLITVTIYTFYNTLLFNLRFFLKMQCVTVGLCAYDAFNYLCCFCVCKHCCREG